MVFLKLRNCFEIRLSLRPQKWTDLSGFKLSHIGSRPLSVYDPVSGRRLSPLDLPEPSEEIIELTQKVKRHEARGLPIVHHHDYSCDLPPRHRFAMRKFKGVYRHIRKDNLVSPKQVHKPAPVSADTASLVHTEDYIERFFSGQTSVKEQRKTGFKWTEGIANRCRLEAGGTLLAARLAMEHGLACNTGGGTHHAFPTYGSGFCLINDLAIAAKFMQHHGRAKRVLIVDLDVHQGDGTAYIFGKDEDIFTFSMHCKSNFPLRKQNSDLDIELPDRMKDKDYMATLAEYLPTLLNNFRPDLVLYDAGVDPHEADDLGKLCLTDQGLYARDYYVLDSVFRHGCACVTVIGGGYCSDQDLLSARHSIIFRAAAKVWQEQGSHSFTS